MQERRRTTTSNFGVSRREAHDASRFYGRFEPPTLGDDTTVLPPKPVDEPFVCGDARNMHTLDDNSVALVVTSPPYFAGKQYEEELERDGVPSSYLEYLELLADVFADCVRVLEPGGRIAANVANLGRKPYRSLSSDVVHILQDRLGLLLRGEIVWQKGIGASGSCAWGSFRSPTNPVLRDVTERIIVASKGRFERARKVEQRRDEGLPSESTISAEDFMALTLDVWQLPSESARRVGHPAPFPVELPEKLIELYTFADDLVLDPFMGSGSTLVAASRVGRRYVGYDLDAGYVELARARVLEEGDPVDRSAIDGAAGKDIVERVLTEAGFSIDGRAVRLKGTGVVVPLVVLDAAGRRFVVELGGPFVT
ncbi:MAG: DNA-methyltransferase, partial [Ilumatobacteraceae bacterium]